MGRAESNDDKRKNLKKVRERKFSVRYLPFKRRGENEE